MYITRSFCW